MAKSDRTKDDWKQWKSGWRYKTDAPKNRKWNKDRKELFRKNGNGWWYYIHQSHNPYLTKEEDDDKQ